MSHRSRFPILASILLAGVGVAEAQDDAATRLTVEGNRFVISIGPVDLPVAAHAHGAPAEGAMEMEGGGGHHGGMFFPPVDEVEIPFDAYIYGFGYEVVDARGRSVPNSVVHHLNVIDPLHRDLFLPISYRLAAVGGETDPMKLPRFLFGHPISAGQPLVVSVMLHNPTHTAYDGATVRFYFEFTRAGRPWPLFPVYTFQMDVGFPAGDKDFDLVPGRSSKSWEGSPSVDGRIIAIGGHVHDHAVNLVVEDVTDGTQIWEGEPILDADGNLEGVSVGRLYYRMGVPVFADHVYRVTVTYDNPTADTIPAGGMGLAAGLFMPAMERWPLADAADELYLLDRSHYMREVRGSMDELMAGADSTAMAGHNHDEM